MLLARQWHLRSTRRVLAALGVLLLPLIAAAEPNTPPDVPIPSEGFWPTRLMFERMLDRMIDQVGEHYEFDDEQVALTRELYYERIPAWANARRGRLQTIFNEFLEAQLHDEPPDPNDVADWAQRALPIMGEFEGFVVDLSGDMRQYMTDDQALKLDGEMAAFQAGMGMTQNKLRSWAAGNYDPELEWIRPGPERHEREMEEERERQEAMEAARREAMGLPPEEGAASQPVDEWTKYTDEFIKRYELNDEQSQQARQVLIALQEQRDQYLRRTADEMQKVAARLAEPDDEDDRRAALEASERLSEPVDRMFQQLKDRLDKLPTRAQRRSAAQRAREAQAASEAETGDDD